MLDRRAFLGGIGGGLTSPLVASAPATKIFKIGYLSAPTRASVEQVLQSFLRALRQLGWVEGQNLVIEYRWAEGKVDRLPSLALELVRDKVDLIVAPAGSAAVAAKSATSSIPIVMIFPSDPIEMGLVASLARPGANVTGTSSQPGSEILGKQLQVLKEALPASTRVATLWNPADPGVKSWLKALEAAADALNIRLQYLQARGPEEFDSAFAAMARQGAQALLVSRASTFLAHRVRIAELAIKAQLPAMYSYREAVEAGGLMAYAVNMTDFIGHAAVYVDKILKGAKPADLPVELPTKFEFVVNLKTAKALGLSIPQSLLLRADQVIQ
ncbi:MAG: ABC transporter substrate-binding protein [Chloroflexia bacterium]